MTYRAEGLGPEYDALCEGPPNDTGFFGEGLVDAARVLGRPSGPIPMPPPTPAPPTTPPTGPVSIAPTVP